MNFVCRSLLQVYQDEEEAFWVFVGMLQRFGMRKLYCPGMPLLRLRCVRIEDRDTTQETQFQVLYCSCL